MTHARQMNEAADVFIGLNNDVAAATAIAPVGTAARDVRLLSETGRTGTAITTLQKIDTWSTNIVRG